MVSTPEIVLHNLINNPDYVKKIAPYLKKEYFKRQSEQVVFSHIEKFIVDYKQPPTYDVLYVELTNDKTIPEEVYKDIDSLIKTIKSVSNQNNLDWLCNTTEDWVKRVEIENALQTAILIADGKDKNRSFGAIPDILSKALGVSFNTKLGHDYLRDAMLRFDYYHRQEYKIPFDINVFNDITHNGVSAGTLNLLISGTHGGKSAMLCHLSAKYLEQGKNVLFISLEMNEMDGIGQRIDANLFDIPFAEISKMPKTAFEKEIFRLQNLTKGSLKIVEFPASSINAGHVKILINEYKLKEGFVPDVIMIDYLGLMGCYKMKSMDNSYLYFKVVAEEVRALGQEFKLPIWSAVQLNRSGYSDSNPDMDKISDSFGVAMTADLVLAIISSDDLIQKQQVLISQLKNRYHDKNQNPKFMLGFDRAKFRFYDLDFKGTSQGVFGDASLTEEDQTFESFKEMLETKKDKLSSINFS